MMKSMTIKRLNQLSSVLLVVLSGFALCETSLAKPDTEGKPKAAATAAEIEALVEKLGSDSFADRQKAATRLIEVGKPALAAVKKAADGGDPEARLLAKKIKDSLGVDGEPIDLTEFANHPRDEKFGRLKDNDLASLEGGKGTFGKIPFIVGDNVAFLGSDRMPDHPRKIEGIKIGKKVEELHMLHGMGFGLFQGVGEGAHVADYVINYADKTKVEIPIVEGVDVRNWWDEEGGLPVTKGKLAWTGENAASKRHGNIIRLYSGSWTNPHPEKEVTTIDMVGRHDIALLFCVAITAVTPESSDGNAEETGEAEAKPVAEEATEGAAENAE